MNLTALLIVNDPKTRNLLNDLIKPDFNRIEVIEKNVKSSEFIQIVNDCSPVVVFCELDESTSVLFELLPSLPINHSNFIFISGVNNPMLSAIKFASLSYLLTPFSEKQLKEVLMAVLQKLKKKEVGNNQLKLDNKISIFSNNGYTMVDIKDIVFITSSGNYCTIVLESGEKITLTKLIGEFQKILPDDKFLRIHQSYIANLNQVLKVIVDDGLQLELKTGHKIPVARRRKKELFNMLGIQSVKSKNNKEK